MTSEPRTAANRQNARSSTGPKTSAGKAVSRQNSRKHGLAVPIFVDENWSAELSNLTAAFSSEAENRMAPQQRNFAAAALADLQRIDRAVVELLNLELKKGITVSGTSSDNIRAPLDPASADQVIEREVEAYLAKSYQLEKVIRYQRRAMARWRRAFCSLPD